MWGSSSSSSTNRRLILVLAVGVLVAASLLGFHGRDFLSFLSSPPSPSILTPVTTIHTNLLNNSSSDDWSEKDLVFASNTEHVLPRAGAAQKNEYVARLGAHDTLSTVRTSTPLHDDHNDDQNNEMANSSDRHTTRMVHDESSSMLVADAKLDVAKLVEALLKCNISYHVYEDSRLEQWHIYKKPLLQQGKAARALMMERFGTEVMAELWIIEALKNHPLRRRQQNTNSKDGRNKETSMDITEIVATNTTLVDPIHQQHQPTEQDQPVDLFIIPLSLGVTIASARKSKDAFDQALEILYNQPTFQRSQGGHGHVLLSLLVPLHKYANPLHVLDHHYPKLWNVTVANDVDWGACQQHLQLDPAVKGHDFEPDIDLYSHNMARYGFSLGLLAPFRNDTMSGASVPFIPATYKKFVSSQYWLFYHTREAESLHNSTSYRHAPLRIPTTDWTRLISTTLHRRSAITMATNYSIGYDLPPDEWMEHFTNSQFCLVIRGDTIHSHALMRAIKVGCIPVVVADFYPWFAPTFKSTIPSMSKYAILLNERNFVTNPLEELAKLQELLPHQIQEKLEWLAFAQRLFFLEHPESLFVPAFLKEAHRASQTSLGGTEYPY